MTIRNTQIKLLLISIFCLTFFSCKTDDKSENSIVQNINTNELTISPIRHDTLSLEQIEKIQKIQATFSEVNPSTLEQTITDFKRDQNPDNEIAIWLAMAKTYEKFNLQHTELDINKKKEAYGLILMRSMENEAEAKANSKLKLLTDNEVAEIFSYYDLEAKPITFEQK
jgi:hypothetical protein